MNLATNSGKPYPSEPNLCRSGNYRFEPMLTVIKILCIDVNEFGDVLFLPEIPKKSEPISLFVHVTSHTVIEQHIQNPPRVFVQRYLIPVRIGLNLQFEKIGQMGIEGSLKNYRLSSKVSPLLKRFSGVELKKD